MFLMEHVISMDDLGRTRILGNEGSVIDATVYHYMSTRNMTHMLHGAGISGPYLVDLLSRWPEYAIVSCRAEVQAR